MMKKLIYTAGFTLAVTFSVPALAGGVLRDAKAPHFVHSNAHPNNARIQNATHHFKVHVQGSDLSQLSVDMPEGIKLSDRILMTDQTGKKIDANISINDRRVTLAFPQPMPSETTLSVSMKVLKTPLSAQRGFTWLYPVYGRSSGMTEDIPIGMARIQTY